MTSEPSLVEDREKSMAGTEVSPSPVQLLGKARADLKCTLEDKELLIQSKEEEERKSSALRVEPEVPSKLITQYKSEAQAEIKMLRGALQEKELAIRSLQAELEAGKRSTPSQQLSEALARIRELDGELQDTIQLKETEVKHEKKKSQQQREQHIIRIRELANALQGKALAIQSAEEKVEDEKRRSSQLQEEAQTQIRELTSALQVKEDAVLSAELQVEEEKRRSSQAQDEAQVRIRKLSNALQVKEHTIQAREEELRAKQDEIGAKEEEIKKMEQIIKLHDGDQDGKALGFTSKKLWDIPRSLIQSISKREIGHGAWGVVYSGSFQGQPVAIKHAHRDLLHVATIDMLKREVMIMANIQHPNLVRFVGAVFDDAVERGLDTPIIVSELMDMNLRTAYKQLNISSSLISIFQDVAYALHYLHQHSQPIIHRDVSAPNVLLKSLRSGGYQAKVSDFGSANLVKQSTTAGAGAIVYCAPEMFPNEDITAPPQPQTTKVDVFSYGILLLEVIVREIPYPATRYTMLQQVNHKLKWKLMHDLIVHCTKPCPSDRPAMTDILNILNKII